MNLTTEAPLDMYRWPFNALQGFELHAEQWLPEDDFTDCMAVDEWEARCKAYRKKK